MGVKSMRSCLVTFVNHFYERGCDTFAHWRNLKSERLSSTSVRKECFPRKFIKSSCKPCYSTVINGQQSLRGTGAWRCLALLVYPLVPKWYTSIEKKATPSSCVKSGIESVEDDSQRCHS